MTIKRFFSNADNTITNAFKANLSLRGTGSNSGQSDILEVFSIFAQANTESLEKSRALINFDISKVKNASLDHGTKVREWIWRNIPMKMYLTGFLLIIQFWQM